MSVKEEEDNEHDIFAVSFEKAGMIVGHVPHEVLGLYRVLQVGCQLQNANPELSGKLNQQ